MKMDYEKHTRWYYLINPIMHFGVGLYVGYVRGAFGQGYGALDVGANLAFPLGIGVIEWVDSKYEQNRGNKDLFAIAESNIMGAVSFFTGNCLGRTLEKIISKLL